MQAEIMDVKLQTLWYTFSVIKGDVCGGICYSWYCERARNFKEQ